MAAPVRMVPADVDVLPAAGWVVFGEDVPAAAMARIGRAAPVGDHGTLGAVQQSQMAKATATHNAQMSEIQAQDAQRRGEKEAQDMQRKAAAFKSSQRVSLAAKGLDLGYGTAADLQDQTDFFSQTDVATTRNNAAKEAFARRSQSANFQAEAAAARPWLTGGSTLLAGAGQVAVHAGLSEPGGRIQPQRSTAAGLWRAGTVPPRTADSCAERPPRPASPSRIATRIRR